MNLKKLLDRSGVRELWINCPSLIKMKGYCDGIGISVFTEPKEKTDHYVDAAYVTRLEQALTLAVKTISYYAEQDYYGGGMYTVDKDEAVCALKEIQALLEQDTSK